MKRNFNKRLVKFDKRVKKAAKKAARKPGRMGWSVVVDGKAYPLPTPRITFSHKVFGSDDVNWQLLKLREARYIAQ